MPPPLPPGWTLDWVDTQADRIIDRQRSKTDNAKIIATFVAGIPLGFFVTALQVHQPAIAADHDAWPWIVRTSILGVIVALCDRIFEADYSRLMERAGAFHWTEDYYELELRFATLEIIEANEWFVRIQLAALVAQVACAFWGAYLTATSLLG